MKDLKICLQIDFSFSFFSVLRTKALTDFRVCNGLEGNFSVECIFHRSQKLFDTA